jgi:hypothetical protein
MTHSFLGGKTQYQATSLETEPETDFHIFVRGHLDKYLGGVLLLALAGASGGNTRNGQGKSLTKFVFLACMARSESIILVILQIGSFQKTSIPPPRRK